MNSKLFKAFTPFINRGTLDRPSIVDALTLSDFHKLQARDPEGSQWRAMGFMPLEDDNTFTMNVQGAAELLCVQLNERILPGSVQREKMAERVAEIERREGRRCGKKEYAEIRDDVTMALLPMAFIRRKFIPVMFVHNQVLIFTSSAKVSDDVISLVIQLINGDEFFRPVHLESAVELNIDGTLTELAREGQSSGDGDDEPLLMINNLATLKGPDKQQISVKDKDIGSHDISELLKQDYSVTKLGLDFLMAGETDPAASFVLNDHLVFSKFALPGVKTTREKTPEDVAAAFMSTAWLTATTARQAVECVIGTMGGLRALASAQVTAEAVEDDEL